MWLIHGRINLNLSNYLRKVQQSYFYKNKNKINRVFVQGRILRVSFRTDIRKPYVQDGRMILFNFQSELSTLETRVSFCVQMYRVSARDEQQQ